MNNQITEANPKQKVLKDIKLVKGGGVENSPFPSDPPHVNPGEYQGTDPAVEHHTQQVCHPHSLWLEPIALAVHQWMPSFPSSCLPLLYPFTLPNLCEYQKPIKGSLTTTIQNQNPQKKIYKKKLIKKQKQPNYEAKTKGLIKTTSIDSSSGPPNNMETMTSRI